MRLYFSIWCQRILCDLRCICMRLENVFKSAQPPVLGIGSASHIDCDPSRALLDCPFPQLSLLNSPLLSCFTCYHQYQGTTSAILTAILIPLFRNVPRKLNLPGGHMAINTKNHFQATLNIDVGMWLSLNQEMRKGK